MCIFVGIVVVIDTLLRRTRFGRHVYAVGGNIEAARRAGIKVERVRLMVFVLASTLAAHRRRARRQPQPARSASRRAATTCS